MQLPNALREAIARELASCEPARLRAAATALSVSYRDDDQRNGDDDKYRRDNAKQNRAAFMNTAELRAAYLAVRLPATFAAVSSALAASAEACRRSRNNGDRDDLESFSLRTVLDLGSGPGTALWAAAALFPSLSEATAIERDTQLIAVAQRLAAGSDAPALLHDARWLAADIASAWKNEADLVLCSYALNELAPPQRAALVARAWQSARQLMVIVEPGTKAGFANIHAARTQLMSLGAALAAPCTHSIECPMQSAGDWCHFAARVERTAEHRRLKQAELGHEDEKFCYLAVSRASETEKDASSAARIVRHTRIFSGYTQLTLCREGCLENATVTRSHKEDWRRLKRLGWGDRW